LITSPRSSPQSTNNLFFRSLGVDLVEIARAKSFYRANASCLKRFFAKSEISFITQKPVYYQRLAMLLAAKEAVFKSLGAAWMGPSGFKNIRMVAHAGENFSFRLSTNFTKKRSRSFFVNMFFSRDKKYVVAIHHQNVGGRPPKMEVACAGI